MTPRPKFPTQNHLLLFLISLGLSGVATNLVVDAGTATVSPEADQHRRFTATWHFSYNPEGSINGLYYPNVSATITVGSKREDGYLRIPAYRFRTNQKGFREEPFAAEKPSSQYRIIVMGDSFTFGWGVNRSDRYTGIVETRLQNHFPRKNITVLNLAYAGYGLRDYQHLWLERAQHYNPDILVVAYSHRDVVSLSVAQEIQEKAIAENDTVEVFRRRQQLQQERVHDRAFVTAEFNRTMARIRNTTDIPIIFYAYMPVPQQQHDLITPIANRYNITLVEAPDSFHSHPEKRFKIPRDGHYNTLGHRKLADTLTTALRSRIPITGYAE